MEQTSRRKLNARRIREAINEIYREVAGESLPHASVANYVVSWLAQKKLETKLGSYEAYAKALQKFLAFLGARGDTDLCDVEKRELVAFRDSLVSQVSTTTANNDFKVVRSLFRSARRDGYIDVDPADLSPL
jgi:site-specific recombinase XerD